MPLSKIQTTDNQVVPNLGRRNLIINGAMKIAQRGTDFNDVGNGAYTLDRFKLGKNNTDNAVINIDRVSTSPDGFSNSLQITVGTAESALAADESLLLQHLIEAQNLQHLKNGSSGAKSVTLSFWVRSNKTGTYTAAIRKVDNTDRNQSKEYTISAADTWEHKSLTFSGDTGGGGISDDNGAGFFCDWWLAGGSNFTGGTMNTWANTATQRLSTNQVNLMDSTNNWYITGVQLEVGDTATDFEHRSIGEELLLCQRYFEVFAPIGSQNGSVGIVRTRTNVNHYSQTFHFMEKRATPTGTVNYDRLHKPGVAYDTISSVSLNFNTGETSSGTVSCTPTNDSSVSTSAFLGMSSGTGRITLDAEL